ncbi:MAG TPA: M1 family metallopeptidase [Pyrinomonadaceae bacterium]|nr:M1 family metallopeptidase [Pyrinomonadaceae bacterium]
MKQAFNIRLQYFSRAIQIVLLAVFLSVFAQAQRQERLIDSWQPLHFDINLVFDYSLSSINSATTDVTVLVRQNEVTKIDFDFGTMPVSNVKVNNETAKFAQHDEKLDIFLTQPASKDQKLNISVTYSGKPQDGLILTKDRDGNPSAVGDNWADRVHHWIPCLDHPSAKASVKFTVTAPSNNAVVANGVLESSKDNTDATKTWVYNESKNISPYNMVVAVGQFANATLKTNAPIPISYYVPQADRSFAEQGFSPAAPSVLTFSNLIAPYPYGKLALIIGATKFGGMENANTIVFTPNLFQNFVAAKPRGQRYNVPQGVEEVIAHEIAHQWFGDSVTEATWADLWLSEGFATYFAGLFLENNEGKDRFRLYMRDKAKSYFEYEKKNRTPIHDTKTEKLFDLLTPNNYEKGGWVLHMMRGMLGDKAFFDGLKSYYNEHKESTATTEDLRIALERSSGKDLKNFFERWIYQAGHPVYQATWKQTGKSTLEITLKQTQEDEAFLQPVTIEIITNNGSQRVIMTPTGKETVAKFKSAKPKKIVIDPDEIILKEVVN